MARTAVKSPRLRSAMGTLGRRNRWKPLGIYGEVITEIIGWLKGPNPNDLYNPNTELGVANRKTTPFNYPPISYVGTNELVGFLRERTLTGYKSRTVSYFELKFSGFVDGCVSFL